MMLPNEKIIFVMQVYFESDYHKHLRLFHMVIHESWFM